MKKQKAYFAEAQIYYTDPAGVARIRYSKGPFKTNARSTETAKPAYIKQVYRDICANIDRANITHTSVCVLDPCDPCDRWILESSGNDNALLLRYLDELNTAAGRTIPRASFLPPM